MLEQKLIDNILSNLKKQEEDYERLMRERGLLIDKPVCGWHIEANNHFRRSIEKMRECANRAISEVERQESDLRKERENNLFERKWLEYRDFLVGIYFSIEDENTKNKIKDFIKNDVVFNK